MKKIGISLVCFLMMVGLGQAQAAQQQAAQQPAQQSIQQTVPTDPMQLMRSLTKSVQDEISKNRSEINKDPNAIYAVVNRIVLPHVDFVEMAKWIAGKSAWNKAAAEDQAAFIQEFKKLVVHTYAATLNKYTDEKVEFFPLQKSASDTRVQISSKIHRANNDDIRVDYRLIAENNDWKLYDIIIEGISILKGFQAQFSEQIRNQGLHVVINKIKLHNEGKDK